MGFFEVNKLLNDPKNVVFLKNQTVFAVNLDLCADVLAKDHPVAFFDGQGGNAPIIAHAAATGCKHDALYRLFFGRFGEKDSPTATGGLFGALHKETVEKGSNIHGHNSARKYEVSMMMQAPMGMGPWRTMDRHASRSVKGSHVDSFSKKQPGVENATG